MPKKRIDIPVDDIKYHLKGLKTLIREQYTQEAMAEYYRQKGIEIDRSTISRKLKEVKNMVTILEDIDRIHLEHYNIIGKLFKPNYVISSRDDQDSSIHMIFKRDLTTIVGSVYIAENNHDITLKADPKLFMEIAEEIEKLGYTVTIVY